MASPSSSAAPVPAGYEGDQGPRGGWYDRTMNRGCMLALVPGALAVTLGIFIGLLLLFLFLIKVLWAWTIPDLFPGAVEQGLIAAEISWLTSFKLALFLSLLSISFRSARGR